MPLRKFSLRKRKIGGKGRRTSASASSTSLSSNDFESPPPPEFAAALLGRRKTIKINNKLAKYFPSIVELPTASLRKRKTTFGNDDETKIGESPSTKTALVWEDNNLDGDPALELNATSTALVIVDAQEEYWSGCRQMRKDFRSFPKNLRKTIALCRKENVKIIWVQTEKNSRDREPSHPCWSRYENRAFGGRNNVATGNTPDTTISLSSVASSLLGPCFRRRKVDDALPGINNHYSSTPDTSFTSFSTQTPDTSFSSQNHDTSFSSQDTWNLFDEFPTPLEDDLVVTKPRWSYSGTTDTELLLYLKQANIDTVLVCGLFTSVCVQHTAFGIYDDGLRALMVADACADKGRARHKTAVVLYGSYMYEVVNFRQLEPKETWRAR